MPKDFPIQDHFDDFVGDIKSSLFEEHTDKSLTFGEREEAVKKMLPDVMTRVSNLANQTR